VALTAAASVRTPAAPLAYEISPDRDQNPAQVIVKKAGSSRAAARPKRRHR
jgi:hypothetical protein